MGAFKTLPTMSSQSQGRYRIDVYPVVPDALSRLPELADDLWYSWHQPTRSLFAPLDPALWDRVGQNPKLFLRQVSQAVLDAASTNEVYLSRYAQAISAFDSYRASAGPAAIDGLGDDDLIAYFCAEYGLHQSLPIYSGGLGILAGHHCKTASDLRLPFVGVGLMYRMGYFIQSIDASGHQIASYHETDFDELPAVPAVGPDGEPVSVVVELGSREVVAKVWLVQAGHMRLYLLDTDVEPNTEDDRAITYQLYGGNEETRIQQEMVLGIGGVRALRAVGLSPTVWHLNEGHAAFAPLEVARELVEAGTDFETALEAVAACTVFTTHTPVPAGHDRFSAAVAEQHLGSFAYRLRLRAQDLIELGAVPGEEGVLNMTTLALRSSRHQNGVSAIHGRVSSDICRPVWPEVEPAENPITSITNGVHVQTVLATEWVELFDREIGTHWRGAVTDPECWERLLTVPDQQFWSTRQTIKAKMLAYVRDALSAQYQRNGMNASHIRRRLRWLDPGNPSVLTIGFARRFATYKRATLLLNDFDRLRELVNLSDRPVVFLFAGKAHPADVPGQSLLREIHEASEHPDLEGRLLLLEGYDLSLARRLLSGVDVWLNNPVYPLEASGTSGMKAAMNGAINLSVSDGWWAEAEDGENGWTIHPSSHSEEYARDREDAETLYDLLSEGVIARYYDTGADGLPSGWVAMAKQSMVSILPRFCMDRVVEEYAERLYVPAMHHGRRLAQNQLETARELARWKKRVRDAWPEVTIHRLGESPAHVRFGDTVRFEVVVDLAELTLDDVRVELVLTADHGTIDGKERQLTEPFIPVDDGEIAEARLWLDFQPPGSGRFSYRIRMYPAHPAMSHPHEIGLMRWAD
ncbi:MAG: alpha-glucan family phosphorylase [Pseudomonadota bacterium]